jgi:ribosomal protein L9
MEGHIKLLGDYPVRVTLHPDVIATVTLHVVSV